MGLNNAVIEREFALMNRTGPTVKIAVQKIRYECIRYANELVRENGGAGIAEEQKREIAGIRADLSGALEIIRTRKE